MKLDVLNTKGEKTGRSIELPDAIYGIEPNDHVIYLDVKRFMINQRQGTSKAKNRNEVHGSTRKLRKQKGGGGARVGSIKSGVFRGGGRIHGPQPRDYDIKLNKKVKMLARRSALAYKAKANGIYVVEDFTYETPKTKDFVAMLNSLNIGTSKVLFLAGDNNENVVKSARNLQNTLVSSSSSVSTYSLMNANALLLTESAINTLNQILK
jgi:large subunit ribosomal protein L4